MSKIDTLTDVAVIPTAATSINANYDTIENAFANTLSRDGSTPNQMEADIDLNGNSLLNANEVNCEVLKINGNDITTDMVNAGAAATSAVAAAANASVSADEAASSAASALAAATNLPSWRGSWVTAFPYTKNNLVEFQGSTFIATVSHTSTAFFTDSGAGKWDLFAAEGQPGAGTGDVVAANAGSEYTGIAGTFRNNVSAMLRAITKRTGLNLATDTTLDSTIYNSDGTNTNGPSGNVNGDSFVSSKIDTNNYNYLWFGNSKAWLGRRVADVNSWVRMFTKDDASGTGEFVATVVAKPVVGDNTKFARFDISGNIFPGPVLLNQEDMLDDSTSNIPTQHSVKFFVEKKAGSLRTWQDVKASRAASVIYQNTTGGPIQVNIHAGATADRNIEVSVDGVSWVTVGLVRGNHANQVQSFTVEDTHRYRINGAINAMLVWSELR